MLSSQNFGRKCIFWTNSSVRINYFVKPTHLLIRIHRLLTLYPPKIVDKPINNLANSWIPIWMRQTCQYPHFQLVNLCTHPRTLPTLATMKQACPHKKAPFLVTVFHPTLASMKRACHCQYFVNLRARLQTHLTLTTMKQVHPLKKAPFS